MSVTEPDYSALLQEIQASNTTVFTMLPLSEPRFIINTNTRKIQMPVEFSFLSVQYDHKAETIYFEIDRYFDGEDLSKHTCIVQFINKDMSSAQEGIYRVKEMDLNSVDGKIIFKWEIENDATQLSGEIIFSVRFYSITSDGYFDYNFNTLSSTSKILKTLNVVSDGDNCKTTPSELDICMSEVNSLKNKVLSLEQYVSELQQGEVLLVQPSNDEPGE